MSGGTHIAPVRVERTRAYTTGGSIFKGLRLAPAELARLHRVADGLGVKMSAVLRSGITLAEAEWAQERKARTAQRARTESEGIGR